jgi:hypothetical protein
MNLAVRAYIVTYKGTETKVKILEANLYAVRTESKTSVYVSWYNHLYFECCNETEVCAMLFPSVKAHASYAMRSLFINFQLSREATRTTKAVFKSATVKNIPEQWVAR